MLLAMGLVGCKTDDPGPKPAEDTGGIEDSGPDVGQPDATPDGDTGGLEDTVGDVDAGVGKLSVEPGRLSFRGVAKGESATRQIALRNIGTRDVVVESLTLEELEPAGVDDGELKIEGLAKEPPLVIEPNTFEPVDVVYAPTDFRADRGRLTVETESEQVAGAEVSIATVLAHPDLRAPDLVRLGTVPKDESKTREIIIYNRGTQPLQIESISFKGDVDSAFAIDPPAGEPPVTLGEGDGFAFDVIYTASDEQRKGETIEIASNDPDQGSYLIDLTVNRPKPCLELNRQHVAFPDLGSGRATKKLGILNCNRRRSLTVESVRFVTDGNGAFSLEQPPEFPVDLQAATEIELTIAAELDEERRAYGNLQIESDDSQNNPKLVEVRANVGP